MSNWCRISLVSLGPELVPFAEKEKRNWLPLGLAAGVVIVGIVVAVVSQEHGSTRGKITVTPISAPLDPYAQSLSATRLAMSEAGNLAGSKVTYLDGHIANQGARTVTAVTVQVLFRDAAHEVAQNETLPLRLIRVREPYVDLEPVSAAPLAPGDEREFRLIFDRVKSDWDGAYPEIRILHVGTK